MADSIFSFREQLDKAAVVQAVFDVRHKAWEDAGGKGSGQSEPDFEYIKRHYAQYNNGANLSVWNALFLAASGDTLHNSPQVGSPMTTEQAKELGAILLRLEKNAEKTGGARPDAVAKGADGKEYPLEPKELSAYLQSVENGVLQSVDEWVKKTNIGLTGMGTTIANGSENILVETINGQTRAVGNGVITKPLAGYYGGVDGTKVGDGDKLDIYITPKICDDIQKGTPYTGDVFVMQQMYKGNPDELKIGYAASVDEFHDMQASTWEKPEDFEKKNQGKYAKLTQQQYQELKSEIAKNPKLTLEEFSQAKGIQYIEPTAHGTKQDADLKTGKQKGEEYTIKHGDTLLELARDNLGAKDVQDRWAAVFAMVALNKDAISKPNAIAEGTKIVMPTPEQIAAAKTAMQSERQADGNVTYADMNAALPKLAAFQTAPTR